MADFADSTALALDVELLAPAVAGRLSPALPAGEQLLEANLYARLRARGRRWGPGPQVKHAPLGTDRAKVEETYAYVNSAARRPARPRKQSRRED